MLILVHVDSATKVAKEVNSLQEAHAIAASGFTVTLEGGEALPCIAPELADTQPVEPPAPPAA